MKKVIKAGPGVLAGLSVNKAYVGESVLFYDDSVLVFEVELSEPRPAKITSGGMIPGIEFNPPHFFKKNITVEHADGVTIEPIFA